jgi:hypothetical protein
MLSSRKLAVVCSCTVFCMSHVPAVPYYTTGHPNSGGGSVRKLFCIPVKSYNTFAELLEKYCQLINTKLKLQQSSVSQIVWIR